MLADDDPLPHIDEPQPTADVTDDHDSDDYDWDAEDDWDEVNPDLEGHDPEQNLLGEVRGERDLVKLGRWAEDTYIPIVMAVLENPLADESVLHRIDIEHEAVELTLLAHPRCPDTVLERLSLSPWPTVRARVREVVEVRRRTFEASHSPSDVDPSETVMTRVARQEERRASVTRSPAPWPWSGQRFATNHWLDEMIDEPDARYDDMPGAMYEATYVELFFDMSDAGRASYMAADPVEEGPEPTYVLERIALRHPHCPAALLERVAEKLVTAAKLRGTVKIEGLRRLSDGTSQALHDDLTPLKRAVLDLVKCDRVPTGYLRELATATVPDLRDLVALSRNAPKPTLENLAKSVTALPYLAQHPSRKVREFEQTLLASHGGDFHVLQAQRMVRARLAANRYVSDAATSNLFATSAPQELAGLAGHRNLSEKQYLYLAEQGHGIDVHVVLAANPKAPDEVLVAWSRHRDASVRAAVAGNPGTPAMALDYLAGVEKDHKVLDALGGNTKLPTSALQTLLDAGQLRALAANPTIPICVQETIATGPNPLGRLRLARNHNAEPALLWHLVDPAGRHWLSMSAKERVHQTRIERAVSRHPHAPDEALAYLRYATDVKTRAAAIIALLHGRT